ncbi:hypothetical protein U0070_023275 [Myodes glareolus]|uniref:DNA-directed primase/polymerase protein n=1 Tax=Myodes glareolus TaxID=447135 RepID=A0AAW0IDU1_MYOGA
MRKWESMRKQIEERASHYERKPLSSVYRPRLSKPEEPPSIWKLFHRQNQAFNFVKSCKENVHVFALECKAGDGQRIYLVTSYAQLWFYYKSRKTLLHCYEVIPENAVCKLYFDLEFNKLANPGADGKRMVALLIELRDAAFKDNIHVGNFVRKILQPALHLITREDEDKIPEEMGHEASRFSDVLLEQETSEAWETPELPKRHSPDLSFLVVKNGIGEKCLFVDLGVYTRNRNFRLYQSSKIGKCVALEVSEDNRFIPEQSKDISEENQYFLSSLVSNVRFSDSLRILTCDTSQTKRKRAECFNSTGASAESIAGFQCSPYPEVDQFVISLVNRHAIKGVQEELTSDEADEFSNSLAKNSQIPSSSILSPGESSDADWDDRDDACFLEATEDAEFADAADRSLLGDKDAIDDIPDELIMEALQSS